MSHDSEPAKARLHNPIRVLGGSLLASSIEWYDFQIYGTAAALVLSREFFPSASPVVGALASFGTFAIGFVLRPLGGAIFGHFGDRFGRKRMLVIALLFMAVATTLIGLLPGYSTIGVAAPILLIVLRMLQGLALGGQWGGSMLLSIEHAPKGRRAFYSSIPQMGVPLGVGTGTAIYLILTKTLTADHFNSWGWRIPFLLGVVMFGVALYVHHYVGESLDLVVTPEDREPAKQSISLFDKRQLVIGILLGAFVYMGPNIMFYLCSTGITNYGTGTLGVSSNVLLTAVLLSMVCLALFTPLSGILSDRFGLKRLYATGTVLMSGWVFALFPMVDTKNAGAIIFAVIASQFTLAILLGAVPGLFARIFPPDRAYFGTSLSYQLGAALGGFAPFIMVAILNASGRPFYVALYVLGGGLISLACLAVIKLRDDDQVDAIGTSDAAAAPLGHSSTSRRPLTNI